MDGEGKRGQILPGHFWKQCVVLFARQQSKVRLNTLGMVLIGSDGLRKEEERLKIDYDLKLLYGLN